MITTKDLKGQNTRDSFKNSLRKSWSLQVSDEVRAKLKLIPQEQRFDLYNTLDEETRQEYMKLLKEHHDNAIADGAKLVFENGIQVLEEKFRIDTDELLIEAGSWTALSLENDDEI